MSYAYAATTSAAAAAQADNTYSFVMIAVIFVLFYFMLIRPQNQRAKAQRTLIAGLQKGDEVVVVGGILGKIVSLNEQYLKLQIAEGCEVSVQRQAVTLVLPKGSLKAI